MKDPPIPIGVSYDPTVIHFLYPTVQASYSFIPTLVALMLSLFVAFYIH
jgi:hypothetical protein